jgi:hypothetical protein
MHPAKVKISLSGGGAGGFPPEVIEIAELLCYRRPWPPTEFGIVLLLRYYAGYNPSSPVASPLHEWIHVAGAPIIGQIRMPLTLQAMQLIRKVDGEGYDYELALNDVTFVDKTPKRDLHNIKTANSA